VPETGPDADAQRRIHGLERENRILSRRLRRLEDNVHQMEDFQDSTSKVMSTLLQDVEAERARSHRLLLNVLPQRIVNRLNAGETLIADRHEDVTVLFSDFVDFTGISSRLSPAEVVAELNQLYSAFDDVFERSGIEKIKTIGDAVLAVGGLAPAPGEKTNQPAAVAAAALEMVDIVNGSLDRRGGWGIRIGVHRGPLVAGVIGVTKFAYDVWGDAVNVASRLQGAAEPGRILVSAPVVRALGPDFDLQQRDPFELKGKGLTEVWELRGRAARSA